MRLHPEVIAILACPKCHGSLALRPDESAFECRACRVAYPVRDGIPVFLVDQAVPLDAGGKGAATG